MGRITIITTETATTTRTRATTETKVSPAPKQEPIMNNIMRESSAPKINKDTEESPGRIDRPSYKDTVMRNVREEPEAEEVIMNGNISRSLTFWLPDAVDAVDG